MQKVFRKEVRHMEGAYLPGNIRQRMQELMKEHKIT